MSVYKIFARNLRNECARFESIAEVCRTSGINRQQFNKYLAGAAIPNARTLAKLSVFFGIEESQFFIPPEDKAELGRIKDNRVGTLKEVPTLSKFLAEANSRHTLPNYTLPTNELAEGYYNCYFPLEGFPDFFVRSVIKIKIVGNEMRFVRHTRIKSPSMQNEHITFGKHHGYVLQDASSIVLLGANIFPPNHISTIYIRKGHVYGLRIRVGLAFTQGVKSTFSCRVCLENIPNSSSEVRIALKGIGIVAASDPSVSKAVINAMGHPLNSSNSILSLPSLENMLGLHAPA